MNMFEEAVSIDGMMKMKGLKQEEMAKLLGVSQPYVANKLRLLKFPKKTQERIIEMNLSERHARSLLRLPEEKWDEALDTLSQGKMSVSLFDVAVDNMMEDCLFSEIEKEPSASFKVARFERFIESAVKNLKSCGIKATVSDLRRGKKLYISIVITDKD